jgi:hypothetical protein
MSNALEATVLIGADTTPFEKGLQDAEKKTKRSALAIARDLTIVIGGAFKVIGRLASGIAGAVRAAFQGALSIGASILESLQQADQRAANLRFFERVFKGTEGLARDFADEFSDSFNESIKTVERQLTSLQDFFKGGLGFGAAQALELTVDVSKLAADLGAATGQATKDVAESIKSIAAGSFEIAASQFGVKISEEIVKQEGIRQGLIEKTTEQLSFQQKALIAIQLLQRGTTDAIGLALENTNSFNSQLNRLLNTWEEIKLIVADVFLDLSAETVAALNTRLDGLKSTLKEIASSLKPIVEDITNIVINAADLTDRLGPVLKEIGQVFLKFFIELTTEIIKSVVKELVPKNLTPSGIAENARTAAELAEVGARGRDAIPEIQARRAARFRAAEAEEEARFDAIFERFSLGFEQVAESNKDLLEASGNFAGGVESFVGFDLIGGLERTFGDIGKSTTEERIKQAASIERFIEQATSTLQEGSKGILEGIGSAIGGASVAAIDATTGLLGIPTGAERRGGAVITPASLTSAIQQAALQQESPELVESKKQTNILNEIEGTLTEISNKSITFISTTFAAVF